ALVARNATNHGSRVDVDLLSAGLNLQTESLTCYFNGPPAASVNQPAHIAGWYYPAPYGIYATLDGHLAISLSPLHSLAAVLGVPELAGFSADDAFSRRAEIAPLISEAVSRRPSSEWLKA